MRRNYKQEVAEMSKLIQIRHRYTDAVLFGGQYASLQLCVVDAVGRGADLRGADLSGADLSGAYLSGVDLSGVDLSGAYLRRADLRRADLRGANLRGADLSGTYLRRADLSGADLSGAYLGGADLSGANLRGADLSGAYLCGADLSGAYLCGADLSGADLSGADLSGAYLRGADLRGANLRGADLTPIRDDVWAVLSAAPAEADGLLTALRVGRVDGSTYTGDCACLVGTIANIRETDVESLGLLKPDANRPAERLFMMISKGDTPETCQASAIAAEWIEQWVANMRAAFGAVRS